MISRNKNGRFFYRPLNAPGGKIIIWGMPNRLVPNVGKGKPSNLH
jgi:hypothetical protein